MGWEISRGCFSDRILFFNWTFSAFHPPFSAWGRCASSDWQLISPYRFPNGSFRLGPTRICRLPCLHSRNFPDQASGDHLSSSIVLRPISIHHISFRKAPPPPPPKAPNSTPPASPKSVRLAPPPRFPIPDPNRRRRAHLNSHPRWPGFRR